MSSLNYGFFHSNWLNKSSASAKLYFVLVCILSFSILLYVIFISKLDRIGELQKHQLHTLEPLRKNTLSLKQGTSQLIAVLSQSVYAGGLSEEQWTQTMQQEINSPLDSLHTLIASWKQPEAKLIYTSLKLSVYQYRKLTEEALFLSADAAQKQSAELYIDASFKEANRVLQKKIKQEIYPQAKQINAQLQDLLKIAQTHQQLQQAIIDRQVNDFKNIMLAILFFGGSIAFLLIRSFYITFISQSSELKVHVDTLQAKQEEFLQNRQQAKDREAKIKSVINNTNRGVLAIDAEYNITVVNNIMHDLFASRNIHLEVGKTIHSLFKKEAPDWKEAVERAMKGESFMQATQRQEGETVIFYETYFNPIKDEEDQVMGVALFLQDVSEQKRKESQIIQLLEKADLSAQEMKIQEAIMRDTLQEMQKSQQALQYNEANLKGVINNTDDRIAAIDFNYKIIVINAAFKDLCARNGIQIDIGSDYRAIFAGIDEQEWKPEYERAFAGEKFTLSPVQDTLTEDGILEIAFNPIEDSKGKITGINVFIRNITGRVKNEEEKQKLYVEAQESSEELQAQQEELRQNLEELMSTQEELEKTQKNLRLKEARLRALINNTTDAIFSVDTQYAVTVLNQVMKELYEERYSIIKEGDNFLKPLPADKKKQWRDFFNRALHGELFSIIWEETLETELIYHELFFHPVKTETDEIIGVSVFIKDITSRKIQEIERTELLHQAEERQEEMSSQQEMLRDNLQELMTVRDELETKEAQLSSQINAINKSNNILECDLKGNILDANESFLKLTQYTKEELIGKNYQIFIPEEELDQAANLELWEKLQRGEFCTGEFKRITKQTNLIWIKATYNPVLNAQGKPYKIIKFAYDITDRVLDDIEKKRLYEKISKDAEELRMQEEELRQNLEELKVTQEALLQQKEFIQDKEARLRALIDNTEDDIYAIDISYKIIVLNKSVQTRYAKQGLSLEIGYNIFSIIPETSTAYWKVNFDKAIAGEKFSIVDQVVTKNGEVYFDISFNPIRNDKNQVIGVSVLSRNINQYKLAEKENLQTIDILRKIQEKVASMNNDKEKEIDTYKQKVEKLRNEMNGKIKL